MHDKRVVLKATCALGVVIVGLVAFYATQSGSVSAETDRTDKVIKEKHRSAHTQQVDPLVFPEPVCPAGDPLFLVQTVSGLCSYLNNNGVQGCCDGPPDNTEPSIPAIEPSQECSSDCLSRLNSMWCIVSCSNLVPATENDPPVGTLCQEDVQELFTACNGCSSFGNYANFATYRGQLATRINIAETACVEFYGPNNRLPVESAAPVVQTQDPLMPVPITTAPFFEAVNNFIVIDQTGSNLATAPPPSTMVASYRTPAPNQDLAATMTFTSFDFQQNVPSAGLFTANTNMNLGQKAQTGLWSLLVNSVTNMNGTARDVQVTTFEVQSNFDPDTPAGWGNLNLCTGAGPDNTGAPIIRLTGTQSADDISCCDNSGCTIQCSETGAGTTHSVNSVTATTSTIPFTVRDCTITSTAATLWQLPAQSTLFSSSITFDGKNIDIGDVTGLLATISSSDASSFNFVNNARLDQRGVNSVVEMGIINIFQLGTSLVLNNDGQQFVIDGNGEIDMQGTITMTGNNQRFIVNPTPNNKRAHLLLDRQRNANTFSLSTIGSFLNGPGNEVRIVSGRVEVTRGAQLNSNVNIGGARPTAKKFSTQQSNPTDFVAEICCAAKCGNDVTIEPSGALFVIPPEGSGLATCVIDSSTPLTSARIDGKLILRDNARIVFNGVSSGGSRIVILGTGGTPGSAFQTANNNIMEVQLSTANTTTSQFTIELLQWPQVGGDACTDADITVVVTNQDPTRPITQSCTQATGGNPHILSITVPAVQTVNPVGQTGVTFRSEQTYSITFDRDLENFPEASFLEVLREVRGIPSSEIDVLSYIEDSNNNIIATFQCLSTQSVQNADSACAALVNDANTAGNSLNDRLNVLRSTTVDDDVEDDDGSNTALYGLFGLAILCPLCLLALCLLLKNKKRKADNQYMQDTATFSNVAASPQPINYPYPYHGAAQATVDAGKPIAVAEPVVAIDAPVGYVA